MNNAKEDACTYQLMFRKRNFHLVIVENGKGVFVVSNKDYLERV